MKVYDLGHATGLQKEAQPGVGLGRAALRALSRLPLLGRLRPKPRDIQTAFRFAPGAARQAAGAAGQAIRRRPWLIPAAGVAGAAGYGALRPERPGIELAPLAPPSAPPAPPPAAPDTTPEVVKPEFDLGRFLTTEIPLGLGGLTVSPLGAGVGALAGGALGAALSPEEEEEKKRRSMLLNPLVMATLLGAGGAVLPSALRRLGVT